MNENTFELKEQQYIEDIACEAFLYVHTKTKAEVLYLKNQDKNKSFMLSFTTLPQKNNGIAHILEHSVLNGSKKFPVKEPFVDLLKSSFQNYLNAYTHPDKTVYLFATTHQKDYLNLMQVYLDGIFQPLLLENPLILAQEGWHYTWDEEKQKLAYKGVVYHEMQGAYSNPEHYLFDAELASLYPNTVYALSAGGKPESIPELTQEEFIAFYHEYYHPSNAKVILYGDLNLEEVLIQLEEYFGQYEEKHYAAFPDIKRIEDSKEVKVFYPLPAQADKKEDIFSLIFDLPEHLTETDLLAFDVLEEYLLGSPEAPLTKALLKEGLGLKVEGGLYSFILPKSFVIHCFDVKSEDFSFFKEKVFEHLKKLLQSGFSKERLASILQNQLFAKREFTQSETSMPKGISYGNLCLNRWNYNLSPFNALHFNIHFECLKNKLGTGYFEDLVEKYLLKNPIYARIHLEGKIGLQEEKDQHLNDFLERKAKTLSVDEKKHILEQQKQLLKRQETPDSLENLARLPKLSLKDVEEIENFRNYVASPLQCGENTLPLHYYSEKTAGIHYLDGHFKFNDLKLEDLPYLKLFAMYLGEFDTKKYLLEELKAQCDFYTGAIHTQLEVYEDFETGKQLSLHIALSAKYLKEYQKEALALIQEVLYETHFDDAARWKEYLKTLKISLKQSMLNASHHVVFDQLLSTFSLKEALLESVKPYAFYAFIQDLLENFEEKYPFLIQKMYDFTTKLKSVARLELFVMLEEENLEGFKQDFSEIFEKRYPDHLQAKQENISKYFLQEVHLKNFNRKALATAQEILYVGRLLKLSHLPSQAYPALALCSHWLDLDYLWTEIRAKGGAYGAFSQVGRRGFLLTCSYRDPHLMKTLNTYKSIPEFLQHAHFTAEQFEGLILGFLAKLDRPLSARNKSLLAITRYFTQMPLNYTSDFRKAVLNLKSEVFQELASYLLESDQDEHIFVVGKTEALEAEKTYFESIDYLY